jgi:aspartyl-tRNA(Asn)/glutamyl-tRNA(Gln) amidotransferase subunit A
VATGAIFAGIGSDTGGSIRMPAAFCGVAGLKPTWGRISLRGAGKVAWTLDHAGPLARTVDDVTAVLAALVDEPGQPPTDLAEPPRIAVVAGCMKRATPEVAAAIGAALEHLAKAGATIVPERTIASLEDHLAAVMVTIVGEASLIFEDIMRTQPDALAPMLRTKLELGAELRAVDYLRAQQYRTLLRHEVDRALEGVDVLVTPTMLRTAWTWRELDEFEEFVVFGYTAPFSLTGNPALSVPIPVPGLPIGLQLVGRRAQDERLLDVGRWIEGAFASRG